MQLDELVARDKIDPNDWLLPLGKTMVRGHIYGLQQDYRIPILIYRKHLLDEAKVMPPRSTQGYAVVHTFDAKIDSVGSFGISRHWPSIPNFHP